MAPLTENDLRDARIRARHAQRGEPRARSARFDALRARLVIVLEDGREFSVQARELEGLGRATAGQLAAVTVTGAGYGLHWAALDEDYAVPQLLAGRIGSSRYMERRAAEGTRSPSHQAGTAAR